MCRCVKTTKYNLKSTYLFYPSLKTSTLTHKKIHRIFDMLKLLFFVMNLLAKLVGVFPLLLLLSPIDAFLSAMMVS